MFLQKLSVINYKSLKQIELDLSPKMNCFFGDNGMGKTNLLDAVFYLSFCKSHTNPVDTQNIRHDEEFFVIQGFYVDGERPEEIYCGFKRRQKKHFRRNKKEYERLSDHIGLIPLVLVSPADNELIQGGSEERRKFMDMVVSQYDREYLDALIRYNKALMQRNALLKETAYSDDTLFDIWEEQMTETGAVIYEKRCRFVDEFTPGFREYYDYICRSSEQVSLCYESHLKHDDLSVLLKNSREKDRIIGFTRKGVHKDDLTMLLGEYPIKRIGSQGQNKTYLIALKLAQFNFLKKTSARTPILLLDDIFDKLDAKRVEQIIQLVAQDTFGQIFITDTNREHLLEILNKIGSDYKIFQMKDGEVKKLTSERDG
ncbi:MAG: DNA replication/repair protein RecF [Candidatus Azobacteroides sp.]|nr:DNA replication/repair protein RecF [Candidatus Azobacteroides sp.]